MDRGSAGSQTLWIPPLPQVLQGGSRRPARLGPKCHCVHFGERAERQEKIPAGGILFWRFGVPAAMGDRGELTGIPSLRYDEVIKSP